MASDASQLRISEARLGLGMNTSGKVLFLWDHGSTERGGVQATGQLPPSGVVRVNVDQLQCESVHGMATDRLLMRPLSGLILSSRGTGGCSVPHLN